MKKHLLILILALPIFVWQGVRGQQYVPLVDTNKVWSTVNNEPDAQFTYWTKFSEDTIISGITYKKVLISDTIPYPGFMPSEIIAGFIREDTISKRIYFMNKSLEEGLIYDFGVNIGDTIHIDNKCLYFPNNQLNSFPIISFIVDTIYFSTVIPLDSWNNNTITLSDNIDRKIIKLRSTTNIFLHNIWIEGIGSIFGVMETGRGRIYDPSRALLCYYENDTQIYYFPLYNNCVYHAMNIAEFSRNFNFFPNPAFDHLIIKDENHDNSVVTIEIIDLTGKVLIKETQNSSSHRICLQKLQSGVYFARISSPKNTSIQKFLIIK